MPFLSYVSGRHMHMLSLGMWAFIIRERRSSCPCAVHWEQVVEFFFFFKSLSLRISKLYLLDGIVATFFFLSPGCFGSSLGCAGFSSCGK